MKTGRQEDWKTRIKENRKTGRQKTGRQEDRKIDRQGNLETGS